MIESNRRPCAARPADAIDRRRLLRWGGVLAIAPFVAGCTSKFGRKGEAARVQVEMIAGERYQPAAVEIPIGDTVVWTNASTIPHTVTCDPDDPEIAPYSQLPEGAAAWRSGEISPGERWERTFDVAGTYVYACRFHGGKGMVGVITVTA